MDWLIELLAAVAVAFGGTGGGPADAPEVSGAEDVDAAQAEVAEIMQRVVDHLTAVMAIASPDAEEGLTTAQDAVTNGLTTAQEALEQAGSAADASEGADENGGPPFDPPVPSEVGPAGGIPAPGRP